MTNGMWIKCSADRENRFLAVGEGEKGYPVLIRDGRMFFETMTAAKLLGVSHETVKKLLDECGEDADEEGLYGFISLILTAAKLSAEPSCEDLLKWAAGIAEEFSVSGECFDTVRMRRHAFLQPGYYAMQRKNLKNIRDRVGRVSVRSLLAQLFMMASDYDITSNEAVLFFAALWKSDEHNRQLEKTMRIWDMRIGAGIENGSIPEMKELLYVSRGLIGHDPG